MNNKQEKLNVVENLLLVKYVHMMFLRMTDGQNQNRYTLLLLINSHSSRNTGEINILLPCLTIFSSSAFRADMKLYMYCWSLYFLTHLVECSLTSLFSLSHVWPCLYGCLPWLICKF